MELLVCTTCRRGDPTDAEAARPGTVLHGALAERSWPEGISVRGVECLSNCTHGCSIVLRGGKRWTYVYGNFDETTAVDTIVDGATKYFEAEDGLVPWRQRPEHFRKNCIARIPPLESISEPEDV